MSMLKASTVRACDLMDVKHIALKVVGKNNPLEFLRHDFKIGKSL